MKITQVIDNVQELLKSSDLFVDVEPAPQEGEQIQFSGYPSVSHYYNGTASDYATNTQNRRAITHTIEAFLVTPETVTSVEEFRQAAQLTDDLLDLLDKSGGLKVNGKRACDILRPVPAEPQRVSTNEGEGLMVTINLICESDISFR